MLALAEKGKPGASGESQGFETASPQLWGEGLPGFIPSPYLTHVGVSGTGSTFSLLALAAKVVPSFKEQIKINLGIKAHLNK